MENEILERMVSVFWRDGNRMLLIFYEDVDDTLFLAILGCIEIYSIGEGFDTVGILFRLKDEIVLEYLEKLKKTILKWP